MKVKIKYENGSVITFDDVRMIKPLVNNNEIIIRHKEECAFQFLDKQPKLQMVKTYINKYEIENIEITEL